MLTCKDIFLFNLLRSDTEVAYGLLENLKDGYLISAKYKSKQLKIKTPNTVMVFSNDFPDKPSLSRDRWKIYQIIENKLHPRIEGVYPPVPLLRKARPPLDQSLW